MPYPVRTVRVYPMKTRLARNSRHQVKFYVNGKQGTYVIPADLAQKWGLNGKPAFHAGILPDGCGEHHPGHGAQEGRQQVDLAFARKQVEEMAGNITHVTRTSGWRT